MERRTRTRWLARPMVNRIGQIHKYRMLAVAPVLVAGILGTGYQYVTARGATGDAQPVGFRDGFLTRSIADWQQTGLFDVLLAGLVHVLPVLAVCLLVAAFWERVFSAARNRWFDPGVFYVAVLFTLMMHPAVSLLHAAIGISFGIVFGWSIFGGDGRSFISPALLGAAVVQIGFPASLKGHPVWTELAGYHGTSAFESFSQDDAAAVSGLDAAQAGLGLVQDFIGTASVVAVLIGAAVLLFAGLVSGRYLLGALAGLIAAAFVGQLFGAQIPWFWHIGVGSFAFAAVFLGADLSTCSATPAGRLIQGGAFGILLVFMREVSSAHSDSVVPVLLFSALLAPVIEYFVIKRFTGSRRKTHARNA